MNKTLKTLFASTLLATSLSALSGCGGGNNGEVRFGLIYIHDPSASTYDKNFQNGIKKAFEELNIDSSRLFEKTEVSDSDSSAYSAAIDLIDNKGCNVIFGDSFGHEAHLIRAAKENPTVKFGHATGVKAHTEGLDNYSNAFASIYEGRYLAGIAAGMKLNQLGGAHKLGYVGAYNYAEVISGYTAYFLGAKSVCPDVKMDVVYTSDWGDETKEKNAAISLIDGGAQIISQHADTYGAPTACKDKGVPNVSYNIAAKDGYESTYLAYSRVDWTAYFKLMIESTINGTNIPHDYTGSLAVGSVIAGELGSIAAPGTKEAIDAAAEKIKNGTLHVFDCSTFTVTNKAANPYAEITTDAEGHLLTAMANVDDDPGYVKDTQVVSDGYYHESEKRSSPYFDLIIDGITEK